MGSVTARVTEGGQHPSLSQPDGFPGTWGFWCCSGWSQRGPSTLAGSAPQGTSIALGSLSLRGVQLPGLNVRVSPACRAPMGQEPCERHSGSPAWGPASLRASLCCPPLTLWTGSSDNSAQGLLLPGAPRVEGVASIFFFFFWHALKKKIIHDTY